MLDTLQSSLTQLSNSWYMFFFRIPYVPEWKFSKEMIDLYKEAWKEEGALEGMLNWYRAALRLAPFRPPKGGKIQPRTLIIWGDQDIALDASMAPLSLTMCEDGQLKMMPGRSHWV